MVILCNRYFGRLRLLSQRKRRRSLAQGFTYVGRVVFCINIHQICLLLPEVERRRGFCSESLVSSRRHFSELKGPGFIRPMQLLRGNVDWLRGEDWLYTYVMTFRHIDSAVMSVDIVKC